MKYILTLVIMMLPAMVWAAPEVKVDITAEKIVMVEKDGKKVEQRVVASEVLPGDVLIYTLSFKNVGDESAKDINIDDPIPNDTVYVVDSAYGPGSEIFFSIDDGKTFKQPSLLSYEINVSGKKVKRKASPEQYTHVRWSVPEVRVGQSGVASFRVRVQ